MSDDRVDFWTDETSVLFTSFWGWTPETWANVGWSKERGRTYRDNLLKRVTNPFIAVIYVTRDPDKRDLELVGKVAGFYLMSHETGDRDKFSHPCQWRRHPEKWRNSIRANRAFTYIADPPLIAKEFEPALSTGAAQSIAGWGKVLTDHSQISVLRNLPWREEAIYRAEIPCEASEEEQAILGMVRAGPNAVQPFLVSPNTATLGWQLYVLRLDGKTDAFLDRPSDGRSIFKIGLSRTPDTRRRDLQKAMPLGAFRWRSEQMADRPPIGSKYSFDAAVAGETAMKLFLAQNAEWLGGEFYLATKEQIEEAWQLGNSAAGSFKTKA